MGFSSSMISSFTVACLLFSLCLGSSQGGDSRFSASLELNGTWCRLSEVPERPCPRRPTLRERLAHDVARIARISAGGRNQKRPPLTENEIRHLDRVVLEALRLSQENLDRAKAMANASIITN